jgi:hypothetical protein
VGMRRGGCGISRKRPFLVAALLYRLAGARGVA